MSATILAQPSVASGVASLGPLFAAGVDAARASSSVVSLTASGCVTPLGDARATTDALLRGEKALRLHPVLGCDGGECVPLALCNEWQPSEGDVPRWAEGFFAMMAGVPDRPWGTARFPVSISSSNFGIDNLYAHHRHPREGQLPYILPQRLTAFFKQRLGWGNNVSHYSHACVSAHLALLYASRQVAAGLAEEALVVSYDFLSPFVTAGFHAMKILTGEMPAPYADRAFGAIGLGDGAAFAVVAPGGKGGTGGLRLEGQEGFNEMYHFTGNHPEGVWHGPARRADAGRRRRDRPVWIKGHGTGTIEAGRLEARHMAECFPGAPLVSWKGALGHTLGSCALVELAAGRGKHSRQGRAPGTVGTSGPLLPPGGRHGILRRVGLRRGRCSTPIAFGGAHYACLLCHD